MEFLGSLTAQISYSWLCQVSQHLLHFIFYFYFLLSHSHREKKTTRCQERDNNIFSIYTLLRYIFLPFTMFLSLLCCVGKLLIVNNSGSEFPWRGTITYSNSLKSGCSHLGGTWAKQSQEKLYDHKNNLLPPAHSCKLTRILTLLSGFFCHLADSFCFCTATASLFFLSVCWKQNQKL